MKTCCVCCKKNAANKNSCVRRTKPSLMLEQNCAAWGKIKPRYIKNQEIH